MNGKLDIECSNCGNTFFVYPSEISGGKWGNRKFCSRKCFNEAKVPWNKGKTKSEFPQLSTPRTKEWNKKIGDSQRGIPRKKGRIATEETRRKISKALTGLKRDYCNYPVLKNEKHPFWKGENANYGSKHKWISRMKGKASVCIQCGKTSKETRIHWANKDHSYKRILEDYISLCASCHGKYDSSRRRIAKFRGIN